MLASVKHKNPSLTATCCFLLLLGFYAGVLLMPVGPTPSQEERFLHGVGPNSEALLERSRSSEHFQDERPSPQEQSVVSLPFLIYLHIPKTAGSSLALSLNRLFPSCFLRGRKSLCARSQIPAEVQQVCQYHGCVGHFDITTVFQRFPSLSPSNLLAGPKVKSSYLRVSPLRGSRLSD